MVGIDRNLSHGQNHAQQRPSPYSRKQLTCRLCGRVMLNTHALIAHIETHLAQEEMASKPMQNQPNQPPNLLNIAPRPPNNPFVCNPNFRPGFPMPPQLFFPGPVVQRPVAVRPPPTNISLLLGGGKGSTTQIFNFISPSPNAKPQVSPLASDGGKPVKEGQQSAAEETSVDDATKPLIKQLERPIPKVVGLVDLEAETEEDKLDLTLKL